MKNFIKFFKGVKKELGRIRWTTKKEMIKYSAATLAFIFFFGLFYTAIDFLIAALKGVM